MACVVICPVSNNGVTSQARLISGSIVYCGGESQYQRQRKQRRGGRNQMKAAGWLAAFVRLAASSAESENDYGISENIRIS